MKHKLALLLIIFVTACTAFPALLSGIGPLASAVEEVVKAAEAAHVDKNDPTYIQALKQAKAIDAARAARDASTKARDKASAASIASLKAAQDADTAALNALVALVSKAPTPCLQTPAIVNVDAGQPWPVPPQAALIPFDAGHD